VQTNEQRLWIWLRISLNVAGIKAVIQNMIKNVRSLDDLEKGIKQLLLESRCSFSDEEKVLLNDCIVALQQTKKSNNLSLIIKVVEILSKLFTTNDYLKDIF
jgi:hypothetical protein